MESTVFVAPTNLTPQKLVDRVGPLAGSIDPAGCIHLSNMGKHFDSMPGHESPAHIYSALPADVSRIFVVREFPLLYANDFTLAWLLCMLLDTDEGSLFIEIPDAKAGERRHLLTPSMIADRLGIRPEPLGGGWFSIEKEGVLREKLGELQTIYPFFHGNFDSFLSVWSGTGISHPPDRKIRDDAVRTLIYSLHGANQKSFVVERIMDDTGMKGKARILDMGGGMGFLGAELALKGHDVTVIDCQPGSIGCGRKLWDAAGAVRRPDLALGNIERIDEMAGGYDLISYFGCLLYIDRREMPKVLRHSYSMLNDGGLLLIHENPREAGAPGSLDYEKRFEADELYALMADSCGPPSFYNVFTGNPMAWELARQKLIMAVIQKTAD